MVINDVGLNSNLYFMDIFTDSITRKIIVVSQEADIIKAWGPPSVFLASLRTQGTLDVINFVSKM